MGKNKRYMALDFGIGRGVAVAGGFDGDVLELDLLHRFDILATSMMGVGYWDFPAMVIHAKQGLHSYTAKYGPNLAGVACNSWGVDFGLLDKTGHMLANPVHHLDARTEGAVERLGTIFSDRSLYQRTGIIPKSVSTLTQLFTMAHSNNPLLDKAVTMLLIGDLVSYFLSGIPVEEYTLASTSGMYDADTRDWSRDIILGAKIPPAMVPEIVAPGTVIGSLLDHVQMEVDLGPTPVIAPAAHGMAGAIAATPAKGEDWLCITSSYWTQVSAELTNPIINDHSFAADFSNLGGVDGTVIFQKEMIGFGFLDGCIKVWSRQDGRQISRDEMLKASLDAQPMQRFFNPWDERLDRAWDKPAILNKILVESGQEPLTDRAAIVRTVLDTMLLAQRHSIRQLRDITGRKYSVLHFTGRGGDFAPLGQWLADATGMEVHFGLVEARAIGNIVLQMMALGDLGSLADARDLVERSFAVETFEPTATGQWDDAYAKFLKVI